MPPVNAEGLSTWLAFVVGVITFAVVVASKSLGGIRDTQRLWRQMRKEKEDARVTDLNEDLDHLRGRVNDLIRESDRMWQLIHEHRRWDHRAMVLIREYDAECRIEPPPPLMPFSPIAAEARTAIAAGQARAAVDRVQEKAAGNGSTAHPPPKDGE